MFSKLKKLLRSCGKNLTLKVEKSSIYNCYDLSNSFNFTQCLWMYRVIKKKSTTF